MTQRKLVVRSYPSVRYVCIYTARCAIDHNDDEEKDDDDDNNNDSDSILCAVLCVCADLCTFMKV